MVGEFSLPTEIQCGKEHLRERAKESFPSWTKGSFWQEVKVYYALAFIGRLDNDSCPPEGDFLFSVPTSLVLTFYCLEIDQIYLLPCGILHPFKIKILELGNLSNEPS
jgi:hypothetical protein